MRIFIAADILGLSPALRQCFAPLGDDLVFLSPWDGEGCPYASEADAAQAFHAQDGLRRYAETIARAVANEAAFLIGLSVGATSLWHYLASANCSRASQAVLYYGSRIREQRALVQDRDFDRTQLLLHDRNVCFRRIVAARSPRCDARPQQGWIGGAAQQNEWDAALLSKIAKGLSVLTLEEGGVHALRDGGHAGEGVGSL